MVFSLLNQSALTLLIRLSTRGIYQELRFLLPRAILTDINTYMRQTRMQSRWEFLVLLFSFQLWDVCFACTGVNRKRRRFLSRFEFITFCLRLISVTSILNITFVSHGSFLLFDFSSQTIICCPYQSACICSSFYA